MQQRVKQRHKREVIISKRSLPGKIEESSITAYVIKQCSHCKHKRRCDICSFMGGRGGNEKFLKIAVAKKALAKSLGRSRKWATIGAYGFRWKRNHDGVEHCQNLANLSSKKLLEFFFIFQALFLTPSLLIQ